MKAPKEQQRGSRAGVGAAGEKRKAFEAPRLRRQGDLNEATGLMGLLAASAAPAMPSAPTR